MSGGKPSKSIWQILILQQFHDNNHKIQEFFLGEKNFQFINGNGIKSIMLRVPEYVDTFPNCVTLPACSSGSVFECKTFFRTKASISILFLGWMFGITKAMIFCHHGWHGHRQASRILRLLCIPLNVEDGVTDCGSSDARRKEVITLE